MASILTTVLGEIQAAKNHTASINRCKIIIKEIEVHLNKRIVSYFASEVGKDHVSMINDEDAFIIENLLSVPSEKKDLVFILHSNGGFSLSAERIIDVCKSYCKKRNDGSSFLVLIPKRAKSAATVLALGADKIYLRDTAELGPVDPPFTVKHQDSNTQFTPAYLHVDAMENILKTSGILSKTRFKSLFDNTRAFSGLSSEIRKKFLEQCNYALYVSAKNELGLSDSIIDKIAADKTSANPNISLENFNIFKDPHVTKSHGRLINLGDLRSNPLCQEKIINRASELFADRATYETVDPLIWEFYVRKRQMLNDAGNKIVKTIETCDEDFINFGQK